MSKERKYPRSEERLPSGKPSYVTFGSAQEGSDALSGALAGYSGIARASNTMGFDPGGVGGDGISGRYGLTHRGYESWRPDEQSRFKDVKESMLHADMCYRNHGLIKNVIDLMGDFGSQGIRLVHPNKKIEKFFRNWFRKVRGVERSERFLNQLYRLGNIVIRTQTAKITPKMREKLFKARATPDIDIKDLKITKNEIPIKFTYLHPVTVNVVGGPLANFSGHPQYSIKIPESLRRIIKSPKTSAEKALVAELPAEIRRAAETSKPIMLPDEKTRVFHYKKDDWQEWAYPMISAISIDVSLYEKLKLADRAALDGAISNLRVITLGDLDAKILPTEEATAKLAGILESHTQAGTLDLIWGPDIKVWESSTNVHQFLGMGKYEATLMAIYAGLGIPPTLTGTFGASGTTNNFMSLKTLTQRLQYGRDMLTTFWDEQIRIVQEAMGFRFPARVEFDLMNLGDEASEKALLIQLADRNLISDELIQHYFGSDPEMERIRTNTESQERKKGKRPKKAGGFHDPQVDEALKKIFAQTGVVTPSQIGIELLPKKSDEQPALKMKVPPGGGSGTTKKKGTPGQGRPKTSKDSTKRKTKTFKPKSKATLIVWARAIQEAISDVMNPVLLDNYEKKNMRSLSASQMDEAEKIKFGILCNLEPLCAVNAEIMHDALNHGIPIDSHATYKEWERQISEDLDRILTIEEKKNIQAHVYAAINGENDN